ncbi:MAG: hypothetical protein E7298_07715 [Lachnospiraceae bacterium]|nr:hypothetical protein [Lachnospiraceae bacterium]
MFDEFVKRFECDSRIVKTFENEQDAFDYEIARTIELKMQGQCVCNMSIGGGGGSDSWWTEERRKEYSQKNVMKNEKQKERMRISNPMQNKEVAKKVAEQNSRKVCVEDKIYDSLKEVAKEFEVSSQCFFYWLQRGYTRDFQRCYYYGEEPKDLVILNHNGEKYPIPVVLDGVTYRSVSQAAQAVGGKPSSLIKALKQGRTYKGHTCHYLYNN